MEVGIAGGATTTTDAWNAPAAIKFERPAHEPQMVRRCAAIAHGLSGHAQGAAV